MKTLIRIVVLTCVLATPAILNARQDDGVLRAALTLQSPDAKSPGAVSQESSEAQGFSVVQLQDGYHLNVVPQVDEGHRFMLRQYLVHSFPFASEDGSYAAQNEGEVKTYERLRMKYQFIEQPFLRKQLRLATDEGLIVAEVDPLGQGHKNGFAVGDIILKVEDVPVDTQYDFVIALTEQQDEQRDVLLMRDGEPLKLMVTLAGQDEPSSRYIIGVSVEEIGDLLKAQLNTDSGVAVSSVSADSPAEQAGLQIHDVIAEIDGRDINSLDDLRESVQDSSGQPLDLAVIRAAHRMTIQVTPVVEQHLEVAPATVHDGWAQLALMPGEGVHHWGPTRNSAVGTWLRAQADGVRLLTTEGDEANQLDRLMEKIAELEAKIDRLIEASK